MLDWPKRVAAIAVFAGIGCAEESIPRRASSDEAYCDAHVRGVGVVDVERVYLPRVIACEHGTASDEALRAQVIAARSYLYYRLDRVGWIRDGQMDQVFSCRTEPSERHQRAAMDTAFQILSHDDNPVAGFYVSGALPRRNGCRGGVRDPDRTERFVTYNGERRGAKVRRSSIGSGAKENRGCMSQRGAECLAKRGWQADRILRFYYGADIEVVRANPSTCSARKPSGRNGDLHMAAWSFGGAACLAILVWMFRRPPSPRRRKKKKRRTR